MAENNENTNVQEKTGDEVKVVNKDNFFIGGIKKIAKGGRWIVKKVSDHPKIAIGVILDVGIAIGYVGKIVVDILTDNSGSNETSPIETTFTDEDSDTDASDSDENSTDD